MDGYFFDQISTEIILRISFLLRLSKMNGVFFSGCNILCFIAFQSMLKLFHHTVESAIDGKVVAVKEEEETEDLAKRDG